MDKFYAQHQFSRYKTAGPANLRRVFGAAELALDIYNVKGSDSPLAQKGTQKHNASLPKFGALICRTANQDFTAKAVKPEGFGLWINRIHLLKNFLIIFPKVCIN